MIESIIRIMAFAGYAAYLVLLIVAQLLVALPGRRVPVYAMAAAIVIVGVIPDQRRLRIWVIPAVLLALGLIAYDHYSGLASTQRLAAIREQILLKVASETPASMQSGTNDIHNSSSNERNRLNE